MTPIKWWIVFVVGLLWLIIDIWAIVSCLKSEDRTLGGMEHFKLVAGFASTPLAAFIAICGFTNI